MDNYIASYISESNKLFDRTKYPKEFNEFLVASNLTLKTYLVCKRSINYALLQHKKGRVRPSFLRVNNNTSQRVDQIEAPPRKELRKVLIYAFICKLVADFDYYMRKVLIREKVIGKSFKSGSYFTQFIKQGKKINSLDEKTLLQKFKYGGKVAQLVQERHVISHENAVADKQRMAKYGMRKNVKHTCGRLLDDFTFLRAFAGELEEHLKKGTLSLKTQESVNPFTHRS